MWHRVDKRVNGGDVDRPDGYVFAVPSTPDFSIEMNSVIAVFHFVDLEVAGLHLIADCFRVQLYEFSELVLLNIKRKQLKVFWAGFETVDNAVPASLLEFIGSDQCKESVVSPNVKHDEAGMQQGQHVTDKMVFNFSNVVSLNGHCAAERPKPNLAGMDSKVARVFTNEEIVETGEKVRSDVGPAVVTQDWRKMVKPSQWLADQSCNWQKRVACARVSTPQTSNR